VLCCIAQWHLGNFFAGGVDVSRGSPPSFHGFDEYVSTEASGASSTINCGCFPDANGLPTGCAIGGGFMTNASSVFHDGNGQRINSEDCTNYWTHDPAQSHYPSGAWNGSKWSQKVLGDDALHQMDVFEDFLTRSLATDKPVLAMLWLHTVHGPHISMPEFYNAFAQGPSGAAACNTTTFGYGGEVMHQCQNCPSIDDCDYKGSIMQMDVQIGRLRAMLQEKGVANNTMLWFSSDVRLFAALPDHATAILDSTSLRAHHEHSII
jgi:hypothetical protein